MSITPPRESAAAHADHMPPVNAIGAKLFEHRLLVLFATFAIACAVALLCARLPASPALSTLTTLLGLTTTMALTGALCAVGFALRLCGEAVLGGAVYGQGKTAALVDTGVFAHLRNPLYVGNCVFFFGLIALWVPLLVCVLLTLLLSAALRAMVLHEEQLLSRSLGAPYLDYLARVPRFWPRLSAQRRSAGGAWAMAALSNVGMLSFAAFRIGVACGGPSRLLGVINVMCVLLWISVVGVRRALSLTRSPADAT